MTKKCEKMIVTAFNRNNVKLGGLKHADFKQL